MRKPAPRRNAAVLAMTLATFALGATLAVFVAGSASAASSKGTTTTKTTAKTQTTKTTTPTTLTPTTPDSPAAHFFVINGTVNAASDHTIVGSSAFPNYTTGAVDNYYSMAHSHVDNSPFAEGTASPADTGPIGQTAAAGNFQQPQYADARWPGDSGKATYGSQGGPYATAVADEYRATADASEASNGLSGPGLPAGAPTLAVPKGFDGRLRQALAGWKAQWQGLTPRKKGTPAVTTPIATVTLPKAPLPKAPKVNVTTPSATVTTPVAPVPTPAAGGTSPAPPVTVPSTSLPTVGASRPQSSASTSRSLASASTPGDGETLLSSSTLATLDGKTLVTSGESSLGRVSLGGGQIVIQGIHVTASIANDGTPAYKAAVSVASATIGGVPVTIDQDGVHVAGQGAGLPVQQASDALNGALKQAGIQLFLVGPEVKAPCGQTGTGTGTSTTTTTTTSSTTTTTSSDQSGTTNSPSSCDQTGSAAGCDSSGGGSGPSLPNVGPGSTTTTTSSNQTDTTTTQSSCDQTSTTAACSQNATTTNGTTTTNGGVPNIGPSTTTTRTTTTSTTRTKTSTDQTDTTTTPSGCDQTGTLPPTGSCSKTGTTTTSTGQTSTTAAPSPFDPMGGGADSGASEETVTATGVHVVFTQPVNQSGVPAQFVEHILGEVFVDSLAVPAGNPPNLDLSSSPASSSALPASSSCGGGHSSKTASSGASTAAGGSSTAGGNSSAAGSAASGSLSPSAAAFGSASQPTSSSTGNSLPAAFAAALRKPLWLLLAYVLWQTIVVATGASLWNWRREGAS